MSETLKPEPTWLVECWTRAKGSESGKWTLTVAPQATGICATCGKTIFGNEDHRA